jgi:hypothetical protein
VKPALAGRWPLRGGRQTRFNEVGAAAPTLTQQHHGAEIGAGGGKSESVPLAQHSRPPCFLVEFRHGLRVGMSRMAATRPTVARCESGPLRSLLRHRAAGRARGTKPVPAKSHRLGPRPVRLITSH